MDDKDVFADPSRPVRARARGSTDREATFHSVQALPSHGSDAFFFAYSTVASRREGVGHRPPVGGLRKLKWALVIQARCFMTALEEANSRLMPAQSSSPEAGLSAERGRADPAETALVQSR